MIEQLKLMTTDKVALLEELNAQLPAAPSVDAASATKGDNSNSQTQDAAPAVLKVGDLVEAQWTDRLWYKAKVSQVIGSAAHPNYIVRYVDYQDDTRTVDSKSVRAFVEKKAPEDSKKRKSDAPFRSAGAHVISAEAKLNPEYLKRYDPKNPEIGDTPKKKRKVTQNEKRLLKGKANWQSFVAKGPKAMKKDSMFRVGQGHNARGQHCITAMCFMLTKDSRRHWLWCAHDQRHRPHSSQVRQSRRRRRRSGRG